MLLLKTPALAGVVIAALALSQPAMPGPRFGHSLVYDGQRVLLVDGYTWIRALTVLEPPSATELWSWDGAAWTRLAERRGLVLLYGGELGSDVLSDMWAWNGRLWTPVHIAGSSPGRRRLHAMAYDARRDRTVLYGGVGPGADGRTIAYDDTWEWDGTSWTQIR